MILTNARIILEEQVIENGYLIISDNIITDIQAGTYNQSTIEPIIDLQKSTIMPGFINCHTHGGYGVDFEMATNESFNLFAQKITQEGITKYCQATVTQPVDVINHALTKYQQWFISENKGPQARQIGVHIEGPFIAPSKKGAHKAELLLKPDLKVMDTWIKLSGQRIKLITYAIELDNNAEFTKFLIQHNIIPAIGHSNASYEQVVEGGLKNNVHHITHLFNGMSGVDQHHPGVAVAALTHSEFLCEVISDAIHIKPPVLQLIYQLKGKHGLCLITDAMKAKGMDDGNYKLGPLDVVKKGQRVTLKDTDVLAGSATTYDHCYRTFKSVNQLTDQEMQYMTSINIAKQLGIYDQTGSIAKHKLADLTVLNYNDEIILTICEGMIAYQK